MDVSIGNLVARITADHRDLTSSLSVIQQDMRRMEQVVSGAAKRTTDEFRQMNSVMATLTNRIKNVALTFTTILLPAITTRAIVGHITEVTRLAGTYEMMGITMEVAGRNAGYSASQMRDFEKSLREGGIAAIESRKTLTQLASANIDLAGASKLARSAQDLAVVGAINSSEAFSRMTYGIQSANTQVLRTIGLNVSFRRAYKELADELNTTEQALTEVEKTQARVNEILKEAAKFTGIYEMSMTSAEKQAGSLKRHVDNYKVALGEAFQPAYLKIIESQTQAYIELNEAVSDPRFQESLLRIGNVVADFYELVTSNAVIAVADHMSKALMLISEKLSLLVAGWKVVWATGEAAFYGLSFAAYRFSTVMIEGPIAVINRMLEAFDRIPKVGPFAFLELLEIKPIGTSVLEKIEKDLVSLEEKVKTSTEKMNESVENFINVFFSKDGIEQEVARQKALIKMFASDINVLMGESLGALGRFFDFDEERIKDAVDDVIDSYNEKTEALGRTAQQQALYNAITKAGIDAESEYYEELKKSIDAFFDKQEALAQDQSIKNLIKDYENKTKVLKVASEEQELYTHFIRLGIDAQSKEAEQIRKAYNEYNKIKGQKEAEVQINRMLLGVTNELNKARGNEVDEVQEQIKFIMELDSKYKLEIAVVSELIEKLYELAQVRRDQTDADIDQWATDQIEEYTRRYEEATLDEIELIKRRQQAELDALRQSEEYAGLAPKRQTEAEAALTRAHQAELENRLNDLVEAANESMRVWDEMFRNIQSMKDRKSVV
jgi:hypothetical protein